MTPGRQGLPRRRPKASHLTKVREMYEESADSYAEMMDTEIDLPLYADALARLAKRISGTRGPVVDTSCGSGHMLFRYREQYDPERSLVGVDLSPRMVAIAGSRLGSSARVFLGDMRHLRDIEPGTAAAVVSFFAIHHLDAQEVLPAFEEWRRILCSGGQLLVAAWEGVGAIDYGGESDVVALRLTRDEIADWAEAAGLSVDRCVVEAVEAMPMDAVYLEGTRR